MKYSSDWHSTIVVKDPGIDREGRLQHGYVLDYPALGQQNALARSIYNYTYGRHLGHSFERGMGKVVATYGAFRMTPFLEFRLRGV